MFADLLEDLADPSAPHRFTVPDSARFGDAIGRLGVGPGTYVVVYDQHDGFWATRLWWQLRLEGFDDVGVLDGGLTAWRQEGRPVGATASGYPPARFAGARRSSLLAHQGDVAAALGSNSSLLLNALDEATFLGRKNTYGRPGRIPGSVHLQVGEIVDPETRRVLPRHALRERLDAAGALDPDRDVIAYCGGGIAATLLAFALYVVGREDAMVYDGSLREWAADPGLPMESG